MTTKTRDQALSIIIEGRVTIRGESRDAAFDQFKSALTSSDTVTVIAQDESFEVKVREVDIV